MNYDYFLYSDISLLKNIDNKKLIINNENKYNFVYFCQGATTEQIDALLDNEGIDILLKSSDLFTKLNGLTTCDRDFNCLKNDQLCEQIVKVLGLHYIYGLRNNSALDFFKYMKKTNPSKLIEIFNSYSSETQIFLLNNIEFTHSEINKLFPYSELETEQYMLKKYDIILDNTTYNELLLLADKKIKIPIDRISKKLINNIVSINDVSIYRSLIDKLINCFDVSIIESTRKKYYEEQLSTVENGVLKNYSNFSKALNSEYFDSALKNNLGNYVPDYSLYNTYRDKSYEEATKFESDLKISNMIIDYLFEDIPTNVIINIKNLLDFQKGEGKTLNDDEITLYNEIASIDKKTTEEKIELFNKIKNLNLKKKFYFDYSKAKDKMVELFNQKMLNKDNINKYRNEAFSKQTGVDIYCIDGDSFMTLIKSSHERKDEILKGNIDKFTVDGSSFSVDSSSKLQAFKDPREYYNIAYTSIPIHQLIHAFPVDSFSKYNRDKKGLPDRIATSRINRLMTPEDFINESNNYNELIISVSNEIRGKDNEFNNSLKNPIPFAIYCYDIITPNDIETAKKYNIGIIAVNTKKYNINNENKMSMYDTMGKYKDNPYNYITENDNERNIRF